MEVCAGVSSAKADFDEITNKVTIEIGSNNFFTRTRHDGHAELSKKAALPCYAITSCCVSRGRLHPGSGGTRCPQRVGTHIRGYAADLFAPPAVSSAIVFEEAHPPS